jgi:hypothetical protein
MNATNVSNENKPPALAAATKKLVRKSWQAKSRNQANTQAHPIRHPMAMATR